MSAAQPAVWEFDAIGTRWQAQTGDPLPAPVRADVERLIARFDREWSRFRTDSVVCALERGGEVPAPADATDMLDLYAELSAATGGAVNPIVGENLARRGYDPAYSLRDHGARPAPAVNRRAWGDGLHHVLDARTGEPVRQIAATWAVAPTVMLADAVATALFFDGGPELAHRRGTPWVRMTTAGQLEWSPGAPGAGVELFVRRSSDSAPSDSLEG